MLGRRTWGSGLAAGLLVLVAACGGADPSAPGGGTSGSDPTNPSPSTPSRTTEATPTAPPTEAALPPQEETDGPEQPVAGGQSGVSIEIPGLPVGTGGTVEQGDSWCGVFFWGESLPAGVELQITAAVTETEGATILDQPCEESPPCPGTTISLEAPEQGCGVTVVPPSADINLVLVRLDGVVHCQDTSVCEELVLTSGSTAALENPYDGSDGDGSDGDGSDGDGSDGDGSDGDGSDGADGDGTRTDGTGDNGDNDTGEDPGTPGSDTDGTTADPGGG